MLQVPTVPWVNEKRAHRLSPGICLQGHPLTHDTHQENREWFYRDKVFVVKGSPFDYLACRENWDVHSVENRDPKVTHIKMASLNIPQVIHTFSANLLK